MKHKVYRLMFDYEKEEKWLNEMAFKGFNFVDYAFWRYLFEDGKPGEYIYRIELLKNHPRHPESMAYIRFMEEVGIECVATWWRWVYFRKKAVDGAFDLFSDCESRIAHYSRVLTIAGSVGALNLFSALLNIVFVFMIFNRFGNPVNLLTGSLNLAVALALTPVCISYSSKLKRLKADRRLME